MIQLREGEKLIGSIRKHILSMGNLVATLILVPLIFISVRIYFQFNFFGFELQVWLALAAILLLLAMFRVYMWRNNVLYITNQRIIYNQQDGFFDRTVTEFLYQDVHDIRFTQKGMTATMYSYGDLIIKTPSESEIVLDMIPEPEKVIELINQIRSIRPEDRGNL